jgi:hypothetical protein
VRSHHIPEGPHLRVLRERSLIVFVVRAESTDATSISTLCVMNDGKNQVAIGQSQGMAR